MRQLTLTAADEAAARDVRSASSWLLSAVRESFSEPPIIRTSGGC
jgi:hypothetical protein